LGVRKFLAREEPRSVGQPLGIAFEDFLRKVAEAAAVDVANRNGIIEVATALRSEGKIAKKHFGLASAIGAMRIAIEHGIDNDEGREWQVTAQGARLLISTVVLAIKSIGAYSARADLEM
jgi:hypothetical protein